MTLEIQNVSFYPDQFEKASEVTLDEAVYVFQNLHWEEQLKEFERRESTSVLPLYSLKDGQRNLTVTKESDKGFSCYYTNGQQHSEFFISEFYDPESKPTSVEIFIGKFFNGTIEEDLNLSSNEESEHPEEIAEQEKKIYKFNAWSKTWFIIPSLIILLLAFLLWWIEDNEYGALILPFIGTTISLLTGIIPHITYWIKDAGAVVEIDTEHHKLVYRKKDLEIVIFREEIDWCKINEHHWGKWGDVQLYSFIRIQLKSGKHLVITNFVTNPMNIVTDLKIHFERTRVLFPLLPII